MASLENLFAAAFINIDGSQVTEGFVVALVVVPANEFLKGMAQLCGVLVKDQVESVFGSTIDPLDFAARLRMAAGRINVFDADRLEIFIEGAGDVSADGIQQMSCPTSNATPNAP